MIWYTVQESLFSDNTVVASTRQGICAILFDYNRELAEVELHKMFPKQQLEYESVRNLNYAYKFVDALDDNTDMSQFDIDIIYGTPFQQRVWSALRKVPAGTTITYSDLATMAGNQSAVRAVASACAANPVSIIVPCHRIIPKSGGIGKYRWGVDMKSRLLQREKANI